MKILLIEDDIKLSAVIKKGLQKVSYAVDVAYDGQEAIFMLEINTYDLIILDINLPILNGFEVLKKVREIDLEIKVIILSAKNQVIDKVKGLELGANDYLEKPFDFLELLARIKNLLRWKFKIEENIVSAFDIKIDLNKRSVFKNTEEIILTNKEFGILEYLVLNKERYISAEEIIEHVWDSNADLFSNSFKFHMSVLKKKLKTPEIIKNIRGKGYKIGDENENIKS